MNTSQIIQVIVSEHEYDLLNIFPFITPNTRLYHMLHDYKVQEGYRLMFFNGDDKTVAIVSEIEHRDGTIWYKIID